MRPPTAPPTAPPEAPPPEVSVEDVLPGEAAVAAAARRSLDGHAKVAHGRARVVDRATNAKLRVTFFAPFWGDYWVIGLGPDYTWAVVGTPNRQYLWLLSRTPEMSDTSYARAVEIARGSGFDVSKLVKTANTRQ